MRRMTNKAYDKAMTVRDLIKALADYDLDDVICLKGYGTCEGEEERVEFDDTTTDVEVDYERFEIVDSETHESERKVNVFTITGFF